jgi:hypothetical protein
MVIKLSCSSLLSAAASCIIVMAPLGNAIHRIVLVTLVVTTIAYKSHTETDDILTFTKV